MDGWEHVIALCIPMLMNWFEVRGLRREMKDTHSKQDERITKLEARMSVIEELGTIMR